MGGKLRRLILGSLAALYVAGCDAKIACDSPEAQAALTAQVMFDKFQGFVVEESTSTYAVCRTMVGEGFLLVPIALRYRIDRTTDGRVSVFILNERTR